jgi:hypothetical protein
MRILVAASLALAASVGATLAQTSSAPSGPTSTPPGQAAPAKPTTPAEAARAAKVAANEVMAECMRLWDKGTHMTKQEWASTCQRIQSRLENLKVENLDLMGTGVRKKAGAGKQGSIDSPNRPN